MYQFISAFSSLFREFVNNPFEGLIDLQNFQLSQIPIVIFVYQYWPMIMHAMTFCLVGVAYKKKEWPTFGSLLYFCSFLANNFILKCITNWTGSINTTLLLFLIIYFVEIWLYHKGRQIAFGREDRMLKYL